MGPYIAMANKFRRNIEPRLFVRSANQSITERKDFSYVE